MTIERKKRTVYSLHILSFILIFSLLFSTYKTKTTDSAVNITATVSGLCGNGVINSGEQCDGLDLASTTCQSLNFLAGTLSCSVNCSFVVADCNNLQQGPSSGQGGSSGGAGGSSGGVSSAPVNPSTNVVFSGRAYPLSKVSILKDGQLAVSTIAGPDSVFTAIISDLTQGNYTFSVYGEDSKNIRSSLFTFPVYLTQGATIKVNGIFISPTISVDKSEVKKGDDIIVFGQSVPSSKISIVVNSETELFFNKTTDENGVYLVHVDSSLLELGDHSTRSKSAFEDEVSAFGEVVGFIVGTKNVLRTYEKKSLRGDLNKDGKVNLIDFSILAYWYKKTGAPVSYDLNIDKKIDLIDFSIMASNWTG